MKLSNYFRIALVAGTLSINPAVQVEAQSFMNRLKASIKEKAQKNESEKKNSTSRTDAFLNGEIINEVNDGEASKSGDIDALFNGKINNDVEASTPKSELVKDEVVLTVSSDAPTKDEATKLALRSAIEQTCGTFVSASTKVVNDELAKDEIATVSSGNIKSYQEISEATLPNGNISVTLQAVVCVTKLLSYVQDRVGSSVDFSGATFGMNMKLKELNKKNEEIALNNLVDQVVAMLPSAIDFELEVGEPKEIGNYYDKNQEFKNTWTNKNPNDFYTFDMTVYVRPTSQWETMYEMIKSTLESLALTPEEIEEYKNLNIETSYFEFDIATDRSKNLAFRNADFHTGLLSKLKLMMMRELACFEIVDNMGNSSYVKEAYIGSKSNGITILGIYPYRVNGNLLQPLSANAIKIYIGWGSYDFSFDYSYSVGTEYSFKNIHKERKKVITFPCFIPKDEIMKYSKFIIRHRSEPVKLYRPRNSHYCTFIEAKDPVTK